MINFEKNIIFIGNIINIRLFFVEIATFRRSSRGRKILGLIKNIPRGVGNLEKSELFMSKLTCNMRKRVSIKLIDKWAKILYYENSLII